MTTPILVDTSYWIDYMRGRSEGLPLRKQLESGADIACTEPVQMELLAGARGSEEYEGLESLITGLTWIPLEQFSDFIGAAATFQRARTCGITPAQVMDCLIVTIALRTASRFMTRDRNQMAVARLFDVEIVV